MQMEQANPLRLAGIYNGVSGSLVGQVPYGYVTLHCIALHYVTLRCMYLVQLCVEDYHLPYHFTLCV
jgi:hypothetical protein